MISAKGVVIGCISNKETITGILNVGTEYIDPITQEKEVTPSREIQEIVPDYGYTGLSKVKVYPYEVITDKKTITKNGIYKACDDNLDGYSEVEVETSGVDINDYFKDTINYSTYSNGVADAIKKIPKFKFSGENARQLFQWLINVSEIDLELIDTSNTTVFMNMFYGCEKAPILLNADKLDTSKGITFSYMFGYWTERTNFDLDLSWLNTDNAQNLNNMFYNNFAKRIDLSNANFSKVINVNYIFSGANYLQELVLKEDHNLGAGFLTTQSANYYQYTFSLSNSTKLTHDSLMNVINGLHDIATAGVQPQKLTLGSTNLAKLTSEEIEIATSRGWSVS